MPRPSEFHEEKRCCTVCDARKHCSVCDQQTRMACSDCAIDLRAVVYVCEKKSCRDAHEAKCPHVLVERTRELEQQLSVACNFHGEDLVPALVARNRELEAKLARIEAGPGETPRNAFDQGPHCIASEVKEFITALRSQVAALQEKVKELQPNAPY